ncbi:ABC transporter permease [Salinisphaera sp. Q1T1-3]|uniref:ABC transporter permease n=1 Tax=Salinisphaera sp. Q1T1-3 TaxID=2321229 RepID=UPI000E72851F|nr:ABC transporter permease [Salinisphaera sp. Q1T1-3]RJS93022.1 ABC transporter permease [Salinisphaera sp. Q1T1-3]
MATSSSDSTAGLASRLGGLALRRREASIFIAGCLLVIYFQITTDVFVSGANVSTLVQYAGATAVLAAGEVMVLICGELDLSIGMVYALSPFLMFYANEAGVPMALAIILALAGAGVVGLINGLVTTWLKLPSFVTTLGMLFLINGFTLVISGGFPVQPQAGEIFTAVMGGSATAMVIWAVLIAVILQFVLTRTRWGLHTIAIGGNLSGATEAGIKVKTLKIRNFMLCSMLAGFGGILDTFRIGSIDPLAGGNEIMFMAIASAVIGGTLLTGGVGTIIGALFGAIVLAILKDGFTLSGVSAYTFDMILGAAILVTMTINVHLNQLREKGRV